MKPRGKQRLTHPQTGTRARDQSCQSWQSSSYWWRLEQETWTGKCKDPNSDRYLFPSEEAFDNAADDLEIIAVSKCSIDLLPQKEAVRTNLQPFEQETEPLAKGWCVKMDDEAHQLDEQNSH